MKGVVLDAGRVVLLRNQRREWELPGGRLEAGESPKGCLVREIFEELNLTIEAGPLLDAWVYDPLPRRSVVVPAYGCFVGEVEAMTHSREHSAVRTFGLGELGEIPLPGGYTRAVRAWAEIRPG